MAIIKNIIFDLGGVIINLDVPRTHSAFEALGIAQFDSHFSQLSQTPLFDDFDKGLISEQAFLGSIKAQFNLPQPIAALEQAWNAMLLDFPARRLQQLLEYKKNYNTYLLSNTNVTHVRAFEKILSEQHSGASLQAFFHKVYYSCEIKLRKPDKAIFEFVLQENGLKAAETVFIDDTLMHVEAARSVGIQAHHLPKGHEFKPILDDLL